MTPAERLTIARIAKVNHAGEHGAIRIYGAQVAVSRLLWPRLVAPLRELQSHEIVHCRLFLDAMAARAARPCRIMPLWSVGGAVLGAVTALMGPKAIWACTEAVEGTVHRHLSDQVRFLQSRDAELRALIAGIRAEEEGHLTLAVANKKGSSLLTRLVEAGVRVSVDAAIWMSTWGDSARMRRDLAGMA